MSSSPTWGVKSVVYLVRRYMAPVLIRLLCGGNIQPDRACAMSRSLIALALTLNAIAFDQRAVNGVDADASALQPQNRQTAAPVLRYAASAR